MNTLSRLSPIPALFIWIILIMTICGCTLIRSSGPPPKYFILSPIESPDNNLPIHNEKRGIRKVIVGPVEIPSYLDRPQIILGYNNNRLVISEENRWAEPLDHAIERVVSVDITRFSKGSFEACPFSQGTSLGIEPAPLRVNICVLSFVTKKDGDVELDVLWRLTLTGKEAKILERHKVFIVPSGKATVQDTIDAMNILLAKMSEDIYSELARP